MRPHRLVPLSLLGGALVAGCAAGPKTVTTRSLLAELTDLTGLAELPEPPFTCRQFSSYDRAAKSPADNWFANGDCGQYLRIEERGDRKEFVMMDVAGPGAIVRIWSANPKGVLRIYLDEAEVPVIEAPMTDVLGGKLPGLPVPIVGERSKGWNSYLPIPYARHCKVTSDAGDFYYHVNYRTYAPGTHVITFKPAELTRHAGRIRLIAERLAAPQASGSAEARRAVHTFKESIGPGKACAVSVLEGPRAIGELNIHLLADDPVQALRQVVLRMTFDDEMTVQAPLGDFYGAAPGLNPYSSLPLGVAEDGRMGCRWVMPFQRSAEVELCNWGAQPVHVTGEVAAIPYRWTPNSMHFHAKWRTEFDVPTRPMRDWNYLTAHGQGVFVGAAFAIANPVKAWWGEGDEKIYVDGETFPSHFGTGTEDYYGYAWCCNVPFTHAYHNQPRCDGPGNYGHTAVNRWHILDCIPFTRDFRFDMELWHWDEKCVVTPSVVAYWYARPGGRDTFAALQPGDLRLALLPAYVPVRVAGALEGEELRVITHTATAERQDVDRCSNDSHLWWHGGTKLGDRLVLGFNAPAAGKYRVLARCVKAKDYGTVQLSVNGVNAGAPLDLYNDGVIVSDEFDLGTFELTGGDNQLTAEIVGANEKATKNYLFGLDYVRLEPVP